MNKIITAWTLTVFSGVLFALYRNRLSFEKETALRKTIYWMFAGYLPSLILIYFAKDGILTHLFMLLLYCPVLWLCIEIFRKFDYKGPLNLFLLAAFFSSISILLLFRLHLSLDSGIFVKLAGNYVLIAISQMVFILIAMTGTAFLTASGAIKKVIKTLEEKTDAFFWGIASSSILIALIAISLVMGRKPTALVAGSFQPTELIYKFMSILFCAHYLSGKSVALGLRSYPAKAKAKEFLIFFMLIGIFFLGPMMIEMGTALILFLVFCLLLSLLSRQWYILPLGISGLLIAIFAGTLFSGRLYNRVIRAWLSWDENLTGLGMQPSMAYNAFHGSDVVGVGIGNGYPYLPKASSDYVLVGLGEEWGITGMILLVAGFLLILKEIYLSNNFRPDFRGILLLGLPLTLVVQAFFAVNGNLGLFVMSGIPIPFISQGGMVCMVSFLVIGTTMALMNDSMISNEEGKNA